MLKGIVPSVEPCGTPKYTVLKKIDILFSHFVFDALNNYGEILIVSKSRPYTYS